MSAQGFASVLVFVLHSALPPYTVLLCVFFTVNANDITRSNVLAMHTVRELIDRHFQSDGSTPSDSLTQLVSTLEASSGWPLR